MTGNHHRVRVGLRLPTRPGVIAHDTPTAESWTVGLRLVARGMLFQRELSVAEIKHSCGVFAIFYAPLEVALRLHVTNPPPVQCRKIAELEVPLRVDTSTAPGLDADGRACKAPYE